MKVTVLLFASVAEAAGTRQIEVEAPANARVAEVRDQVLEAYPALERFAPNLMYAVNEEYAGLDTPVEAGSRVAFIPPVSGGGGLCFV